MIACVTGANGSCASYLIEELEAHGDKVARIARPDCDMNDFARLCERLDAWRPDVIYHLASQADVKGIWDDPQPAVMNNINITVNLFEACRKINWKPHIVICSSSEVYGNPGRWPITEDFPINPVNPYAVSKATQDMLGGVYATYGFPVVRTRAFGYINPRRATLALSSFARQIVAIERGEKDYLTHGNLESVRTFCDVRDIARAYRLAAGLTGVFNIGSESRVTIGECLDFMIRCANAPIKKVPNIALMRPVDVTDQVPDCFRFRNATGWHHKILLVDSLKWLLSTSRELASASSAK